jgi:hypothetical protein
MHFPCQSPCFSFASRDARTTYVPEVLDLDRWAHDEAELNVWCDFLPDSSSCIGRDKIRVVVSPRRPREEQRPWVDVIHKVLAHPCAAATSPFRTTGADSSPATHGAMHNQHPWTFNSHYTHLVHSLEGTASVIPPF